MKTIVWSKDEIKALIDQQMGGIIKSAKEQVINNEDVDVDLCLQDGTTIWTYEETFESIKDYCEESRDAALEMANETDVIDPLEGFIENYANVNLVESIDLALYEYSESIEEIFVENGVLYAKHEENDNIYPVCIYE